jgi:hypothetical protein
MFACRPGNRPSACLLASTKIESKRFNNCVLTILLPKSAEAQRAKTHIETSVPRYDSNPRWMKVWGTSMLLQSVRRFGTLSWRINVGGNSACGGADDRAWTAVRIQSR